MQITKTVRILDGERCASWVSHYVTSIACQSEIQARAKRMVLQRTMVNSTSGMECSDLPLFIGKNPLFPTPSGRTVEVVWKLVELVMILRSRSETKP